MEHRTLKRRRYAQRGQCDDCGWERPTTVIHFWVSNMRYRVCKECIKPYRGQILKPCICER